MSLSAPQLKDEPRRSRSLTSRHIVPPIPSGKQRCRFAGGAGAGTLLCCCCCCCCWITDSFVGEDDNECDEVGSSKALLDRPPVLEGKEGGGELLRPGDMNPKALRAENRPPELMLAPKLVRRGGWGRSAFVIGCAALSCVARGVVLVLRMRSCRRRNVEGGRSYFAATGIGIGTLARSGRTRRPWMMRMVMLSTWLLPLQRWTILM